MTKRAKILMLGAGVALFLISTKKGNEIMNSVSNAVWLLDPRGNKYDAQFAAAETKYGLPKNLLRRMAYQESRFNPAAKSLAGALGLMQFMPATAKSYGIDPLNPAQSIDAAGKMMAQMYKQFGSWSKALAAYNWGSGNLTKFLAGQKTMPAETVAYMKQAADLGVA